MPVVLVLIPDWETNSLPPGASAVTVNKGKVSAVTKAATHFGVEVGMKLGLAQQLCADLVVLAEDKLRAQRAFLPVLEALDEVSAFVQAVRPGLAIFPLPKNLEAEFLENSLNAAISKFLEATVDTVATYTGAESYAAAGESLLDAWHNL